MGFVRLAKTKRLRGADLKEILEKRYPMVDCQLRLNPALGFPRTDRKMQTRGISLFEIGTLAALS